MIADETRDRLILEHRDYADALARQVYARLPRSVEWDEVRALAYSGLVESAARFDPALGLAFKTFAYYRIRGAVFDGIAAWTRSSRDHLDTTEVATAVTLEDGLNDVAAEVAECAAGDVQIRRNAARMFSARAAVVFLLSEREQSNEPRDPADRAQLDELRSRLRGCVDQLPSPEAAIVRMHYFEGAPFSECAEALGKNKGWISKLHARALDQLRLLLRDGCDARDAA